MMKDAYDPRALNRTAVLPPQAVSATAYCYRKPIVGNQERPAVEASRDMSSHHSKQATAPCGMAAKLAPDIAINIDTNPFFMTRAGVTKVQHNDRIAIDASLLHGKAPYGAIGTAATTATAANGASHRKVPVQFGMTRMY